MNDKSVAIVVLALGLHAPLAGGDEADREYRTERHPKMAAFYSIDPKGRSIPERPVVATITSPNAGATRPAVPEPIPLQNKNRSRNVTITIRQAHHNRRAAAACESHGLFRSRDGRCVQATRYRPASPKLQSSPQDSATAQPLPGGPRAVPR
jgi:hypothetical protein